MKGLFLVLVIPLLSGCGAYISNSTRSNWVQRISSLEHNLSVSRKEIDKLATHALNNQIEWCQMAAEKQGWPDEDLQDTRIAVRDRTETQRRFLSEIRNVEDELHLLAGEIQGGP